MPRKVSAREPLTACLSVFALTTCEVSIPTCVGAGLALPVAARGCPRIAPAKTSATPSTDRPIENRCVVAISHLTSSLLLRFATSHGPQVTSCLSLLLFLQNLHQIIVAFFGIHQRELGHCGLLQPRIFFASRNSYQRVRVALNEKRVEHCFLILAVGFFGVDRQERFFGIGRTDQAQITNRCAAN